MEISDLLKRSKPFNELPVDVLREIGKIAHLVQYKQGELIYDVGSKADAIYLIICGRIVRTISPPVSATTQVKEFKAGDVFGWVSLFQDLPYGLPKRVANATCLEDVTLIKIGSRELELLLDKKEPAQALMMERFVKMIVDEFMIPGSTVTFTERSGKMIPSFMPSAYVDQLLNNPDLTRTPE